ncbi:cytochrome b/b6 domain-containing protein [Tropicimonas sp. TH_r6]|uniref:cytochrome b/b6 domain-containing protein n=1 Tax=Tropicimonas sp. TH_r6 TaxID=3082085 RepID=UPI00295444D1|nr:cytochrome b/b6 domain-containing protein [Tropicimonas sp. TH_r6]MDV7143722.1 cytochrome b/b6 domain-containing protein [Tropicimonas sp. TH_r6]
MIQRTVQIFPPFERFYHWAQVVLVILMTYTGFRLYGIHEWMAYDQAVLWHTYSALLLMLLWVFAIFWHLTTGTWRHYVPTTDGLIHVMRFYSFGIFKGEDHPYRKVYWRKHNPLQSMAYLALKVLVFPLIWITGIAYLTYRLWEPAAGSGFWIEIVGNLHVLAAFGILSFIVMHLYLMTTGHSIWHHVKPMFTGYDEVELTPAEEAYLEQDEPGRIKPAG